MKSKSIIFLAVMTLASLPALASASTISAKASLTASSTATSTASVKAEDPLLALVAKFSDSIAQVNAKIASLENTDTDVAPAQKYIENARSGLNAVKISLASITVPEATSTGTTTAPIAPASAALAASSTASVATSTSDESPKTREEVRKEAKRDLIGVYNNILAAITALKKSITLERVRLDIPYDDSGSETIAPAAPSAATSTSTAATSTAATATSTVQAN